MAGALTAIGVFALAIMLGVAADVDSVGERAKLQIEAIKYGLGSVAAGGAAAALLLAVRRQRHAEQIHEHTVDDAAERRVTDLYTKASEQLGHADAAVRLAGLYALERVAQNNPRQRQTIVNVLCAYLRMPYTPPADHKPETTSVTMPLAALPLPSGQPVPDMDRDPHQELQVRLTAQRILTTHLSAPSTMDWQHAASLVPEASQPFWPRINLDLGGATLVNWEFESCQVEHAVFTAATFVGSTSFGRATFIRSTRFTETTFTGPAEFGGALFLVSAWFSGATFNGSVSFLTFSAESASFDAVTFDGAVTFDAATLGDASFDGSTFGGNSRFEDTSFNRNTRFDSAVFNADAAFSKATFSGDTRFDSATFRGSARFERATFAGGTRFDSAVFNGDAEFSMATFNGVTRFDHATFAGGARFYRASFASNVQFTGATFGGARFNEATFESAPVLDEATVTSRDGASDIWPPGWRAVSRGTRDSRLLRKDCQDASPTETENPPQGAEAGG